MDKKGRLLFVRHGQTPANIGGVWHGSTDTPLSELGHLQVKWLGDYFEQVMVPDVIYASPLQRAHLTARGIAEPRGLSVKLDPRLQEFCLGEWEGVTFDAISQIHDPHQRLNRDPDFAPPGGESQKIVRQRMIAAIEEILLRHPEENVVVVSHGVALAIALAHYLHQDTTRWVNYSHQNTAISELCTTEKKLLFFNKTDHYRNQ